VIPHTFFYGFVCSNAIILIYFEYQNNNAGDEMKNLGLFVAGSTLMMLLMGTVYSYSVFRVLIEDYYDINATLSGIP
jgi:hypothetical protein